MVWTSVCKQHWILAFCSLLGIYIYILRSVPKMFLRNWLLYFFLGVRCYFPFNINDPSSTIHMPLLTYHFVFLFSITTITLIHIQWHFIWRWLWFAFSHDAWYCVLFNISLFLCVSTLEILSLICFASVLFLNGLVYCCWSVGVLCVIYVLYFYHICFTNILILLLAILVFCYPNDVLAPIQYQLEAIVIKIAWWKFL